MNAEITFAPAYMAGRNTQVSYVIIGGERAFQAWTTFPHNWLKSPSETYLFSWQGIAREVWQKAVANLTIESLTIEENPYGEGFWLWIHGGFDCPEVLDQAVKVWEVVKGGAK